MEYGLCDVEFACDEDGVGVVHCFGYRVVGICYEESGCKAFYLELVFTIVIVIVCVFVV